MNQQVFTNDTGNLKAVIKNRMEQAVVVTVTEKDKPCATVTFGPTHTSIELENAYMGWSKQVVRLAKEAAGVGVKKNAPGPVTIIRPQADDDLVVG